MKHLKQAIALAVAGVLSAATVATSVAPVEAQAKSHEDWFTIRVCNDSSVTAAVSWSYQRAQERGTNLWYYEGWTVIAPGRCDERQTVNRNVYIFATQKDVTTKRWEGSHQLCVWYPGPYKKVLVGGQACDGTLEPYEAMYIRESTLVYHLEN